MIFLNPKNNFLVVLTLFLLSLVSVKGQSLLFPTDYLFDVKTQKAVIADTVEITHSSLQPFIYKEITPDTFKKIKYGADPFFDKVFYENLIQVRHIDKSSGYDRKFHLDINPILNFTFAKDMLDTSKHSISTNTRGFWVRGALGKKLTFESAFIENQFFTPAYLNDFALAYGVVPGQGRWKTFKGNGFDYAMSSGIIQFKVTKTFTIRLGHGKQKIGNGYRSLLLSDNSFNYPYLQFIKSFFKQRLQYSQTYALLMNLSTGGSKIPPGTEQIFQKKAASFQHLSWHTSKYLDIYFFQGMIWKATDSNNVMHLDPFYANPIIFSNLANYGFNNVNHILVGGGFQATPFKKLALYSQFMYDGNSVSSGTNIGYQFGLKYFDVLGLKNLFLQYEYNYISKNAYQDSFNPAQNYSHYNQSLASPALFSQEHIGIMSYAHKRFFIQLKENYSCGISPNKDQYVNYFDGKLGYMVNPNYNFTISLGSTLRTYSSGIAGSKLQEMQLFYVSLRTSLYNLYYDF